VLQRDKYRCVLCGASGVSLEVDHKIPVARGGSDDLDNLQTLCFPCNRGKRDSLE
jgi:5-methylcytosine-specific restriction endonuclease McrA